MKQMFSAYANKNTWEGLVAGDPVLQQQQQQQQQQQHLQKQQQLQFLNSNSSIRSSYTHEQLLQMREIELSLLEEDNSGGQFGYARSPLSSSSSSSSISGVFARGGGVAERGHGADGFGVMTRRPSSVKKKAAAFAPKRPSTF